MLHLTGWMLFATLITGFLASGPDGGPAAGNILRAPYILFFLTYIVFYYLNTELLIPKLYLQKRYFFYFFCVLSLFLVVFFLKPFDRLLNDGPLRMHSRMPPPGHEQPMGIPKHQFEKPPPHRTKRIDIVSVVLFVMVWSLSTALEVIKQWRLTQQRALRAETDKAQAELSFLKAQINPHFLFNTLNNIYSQAISNSEHTADSIMKLSNIMRYLTDEAAKDFVDLQDEVSCIQDYIDLQKMRLNRRVELHFTVSGNVSNKKVAPLVLVAFIENVFKYGISTHEQCSIVITLDIFDDSIHFKTRNKIISKGDPEARTGIGISNTRKRLEFLYPGRHQLNIETDDDNFRVDLTLYF